MPQVVDDKDYGRLLACDLAGRARELTLAEVQEELSKFLFRQMGRMDPEESYEERLGAISCVQSFVREISPLIHKGARHV